MKNNKSEDASRWKAKWLKEGEDDIIKSQITILNIVAERHLNTMNRDSSKGWIQRKNPGKPERDIYNKYSVQSI